MTQNEKSLVFRTSEDVLIDAIGAGEISDHREDIFFAAIQTTRMPMIVTDPRRADNPIVFANRAFMAMTGYAVDDLIGRNCRFLQGPGTDRQTLAEVRESIADRRECNVEILNYRKDGTAFWNALFISPVFDKNGTLVYYFASQLDVSRRRDAEDSLAQAQKMEALGQLTGGIAHDFNNLLQVMSGNIELLQLQARRDGANGKALRGIGLIADAVQKASSLTQQLLAFSRKQTLKGRVVNLNSSLQGLHELVARAVGDDVRIEYELLAELPNCEIDTTQFEAAILNLAVNARDAMPRGGAMRIRTDTVDIGVDDASELSGLEPGSYVTVIVTDDGEGIPPEIVGRVMDPFFTTKEEGHGTGLGLSMVYGFMKQSRGTTRIYSEVGYGTTIRLFFPATNAPVRSSADRRANVGRGGSERILVVDDRPEVGELACEMLRELGYDVEFVPSAREALESLRACPNERRPQLVFSDVVMPGGMNGYALAREIRSRYPAIRVLLTTGFDRDFAKISEQSAAHFEIIRKPFRLSHLASRVRSVLDGPIGSANVVSADPGRGVPAERVSA